MSNTNNNIQNQTESKPRGRPRKYATEDERKAAVKAQKHAWYLKNKEKKAALKAAEKASSSSDNEKDKDKGESNTKSIINDKNKINFDADNEEEQ